MNLQSPEMSKASQVQMKIESKIGKVSDLFADIQAIMAELAALEPPTHPGEKATDQEKAAYASSLNKFKDQVSSLNSRLETVQTKLSKAQGELAKLQGQELPAAQQEDAQRMREAMDQARKAMDDQLEALAGSSEGEDSDVENDLTTRDAQSRVSVKMVRRDVGIQLAVQVGDNVDFGEAKDSQAKTTKVPPTPARGI